MTLLASPLTRPLPPKALPAKLLAWLNLSHLENATVFVIVKARAMTIHRDVSFIHLSKFHMRFDLLIVTSQIKLCSLKTASIPKPTQHAGAIYMLNQKNLLSV